LLSGGQLKKLMLIKSVYLCCSQKKILICDEPTTGISLEEGLLLIERVKIISKKFNFKVIIACHHGTYDKKIFDKVYYLNKK
jgi:ABC-type multidrug transport system ATPase subunit